MSIEIEVNISTGPRPQAADLYDVMFGDGPPQPDNTPILRVEAYDALDGYGIAGEDMKPGGSRSFNSAKDFQIRFSYLRDPKIKPIYSLHVYINARNTGKVALSWVLPDGRDASGILSPGKTVDLRDWWTGEGAWIIEATQ